MSEESNSAYSEYRSASVNLARSSTSLYLYVDLYRPVDAPKYHSRAFFGYTARSYADAGAGLNCFFQTRQFSELYKYPSSILAMRYVSTASPKLYDVTCATL